MVAVVGGGKTIEVSGGKTTEARGGSGGGSSTIEAYGG